MTPSSKTLKSRCTPLAARVLVLVPGVDVASAPEASAPEQMPMERMPMEQADAEGASSQSPNSKSQGPKGGPKDPLAPIGTARLRALREAIRNGTYPTEAQIVGGLERLFEDGPQ